MTLFWIITAGMILAALAVLAPTLLRRHQSQADTPDQLNVAIARERLAELVKQRETGDLSDEEFAQARHDLELALVEDLGAESAADGSPPVGGGGGWALPVAAILIVLTTIPVYLQIGAPELIEAQAGNAQAGNAQVASPHNESGEAPPMGELVKQLRARMEADPTNAEGWFLLGRTYMSLSQFNDAVSTFERVVELAPDELTPLLALADAMAMRDEGKISTRAVEILERARAIDPDSITALWLLGISAADGGDRLQALEHWERAYPLLDGQPEMREKLAALIRRAGGEPPQTADDLPSIMGTAPVAARNTPPATDTAPAAATGGPAIVVEVALTPALMEQVAATDTVFVLARAESGPPMPLAVARHQAGELPLRITLTDAMAMMPAMKLSSFDRVKVTAKVSKSGQPITQPGDMVASDQVVETGNPPDSVQLVIDRVVE